jgi:hypothetical protein
VMAKLNSSRPDKSDAGRRESAVGAQRQSEGILARALRDDASALPRECEVPGRIEAEQHPEAIRGRCRGCGEGNGGFNRGPRDHRTLTRTRERRMTWVSIECVVWRSLRSAAAGQSFGQANGRDRPEAHFLLSTSIFQVFNDFCIESLSPPWIKSMNRPIAFLGEPARVLDSNAHQSSGINRNYPMNNTRLRI